MNNLLHPHGDMPENEMNSRTLESDHDLGTACRICANQGQTCCQGHDIYVTRGDCERIGRHVQLADFFEFRACSHADYANQDDDPVWREHVFRSDGCRRVLKRDAGGNCLFLGVAGCSLPLITRPLICRLYPHLYSAAGIAGSWDDGCPAAKTQIRSNIEQGIAGVRWQEAIQWHRMLYSEILWEADANENRVNL